MDSEERSSGDVIVEHVSGREGPIFNLSTFSKEETPGCLSDDFQCLTALRFFPIVIFGEWLQLCPFPVCHYP